MTTQQRLERGNEFNRRHRDHYPYQEVRLEYTDRSGSKRQVRVDSYDPFHGEIVERKFTQLGEIKEQTAKKYIDQLANKYPPGAKILAVPSNHPELRGRLLEGTQILEVPVQKKSIPKSILDYATEKGIIIRDTAGQVYN